VTGAEIHFIGAEEYGKKRNAIMEEYARHLAGPRRKAYIICEGGSNAIGTWGYVRATEEIYHQVQSLKLKIDGIVAAVGSGGTHSGLLLGTKLLQWKVPVHGINICDNSDYFKAKIAEEISDTVKKYRLHVRVTAREIRIIDEYVGEGYGIAPMPVHDLIQCLASETGIILEPVYTGKAFYGLIQEIGKGTFGKRPNIIFVHTGGIFGLLTQNFSCLYRR
jgi:D-cysteine desulfhydrase